MGLFYERLIRPALFLQDPEKAHDRATFLLAVLSGLPGLLRILGHFHEGGKPSPIELFGIKFPNPVGMAAGLDKNGCFWRAGGALGFGFAEIGTVTCSAQAGNPRPRLFRIPAEKALVNRMGFNNEGAEKVAERLKAAGAHRRRPIPLGINIGKSKAVSLERAAEDYLKSFHLLAPFADYFAVNVSSPNTPRLRKLQGRDYLPALLKTLRDANLARARELEKPPLPMLLKIAPDLTHEQIDSILETLLNLNYDGIIVANSTLQRPRTLSSFREEGGLTGRPLHGIAVEIIRYVNRITEGRLPIIGVGGIQDAAGARETMDAGASLIQLYTGLVYRGPFLPGTIARALTEDSGQRDR